MELRRNAHTVMVAESHTIGSLAIIRSLGRAGYRVLACSPRHDALGFHSRYCSVARVQPAYEDGERFNAWLDQVLREEGVALIIPSEAFILAIRGRFEQFAALLPCTRDETLTYRALSKFDLFETCVDAGLSQHLPPFLLVYEHSPEPSIAALRALGEPLFLKVDAGHAVGEHGAAVIRCQNAEVAATHLAGLRKRYQKVLVQGYVSGVGVGAFLARWHGETLAEFMHRRIHEVPHTGGASSYRRSWRHDAVLADARARMQALGWEGVGMFEYRWNPDDDRFYLMEFNSRFWGSLHLALYAQVDFPRLLADAYFGHPAPAVLDYPEVRSRWTFPRELEYVLSCLKDGNLSPARRLWPVLEFFLLGLNPGVHSDLNFPGDRALYARAMVRTVRKFLQ